MAPARRRSPAFISSPRRPRHRIRRCADPRAVRLSSSASGAAAEPGSGFEAGGALDTGAPDGVLAGLTDAVTRDGRLAGLTDDELIGVLRAWRRLESWSSAGVLAAIAELARRRPADKTSPAPPGQFPAQVSEFASDEVAAALTLTGPAAAVMSEVALDLAVRLPGTFQAQHAGLIDYPRARLIAEVDPDPDQRASAPGGGEDPARGRRPDHRPARAALARAVIAVDPGAATRRREEAQKDPAGAPLARGRRHRRPGRDSLPPADVLAADQRLTDRALALRAAGLPGSLEELRARAYLDALLGRDSTPPADPASGPPGRPLPSRRPPRRSGPAPARRRPGRAWRPGST